MQNHQNRDNPLTTASAVRDFFQSGLCQNTFQPYFQRFTEPPFLLLNLRGISQLENPNQGWFRVGCVFL